MVYFGLVAYLMGVRRIEVPGGRIDDGINIKKLNVLVAKIRPFLDKLVKTQNFKYFRVDYKKPCQFTEQELCLSKKKCELKCECKKEELPVKWLMEDKRLERG